jgi:xylose isomerase
MKVPMMTTNLFTHPVFKDGGFTSNDRQVRRYALRKVLRNLDLAAEMGAETYVLWGGREGSRPTPPRTCAPRWTATARPWTCSRSTPSTAATGCASRWSPSRTSRAATSCCRRSAMRWASSRRSSTPTWSGSTPRSGHEQMSNLNFVHGIAQALWQGKLFHIDLNGQHGPKFDQDLTFGHGDLLSAFFLVDLLENGGPDGGRSYDGPRHFDYKPLRTEDMSGVWASAYACMQTYLLLKERAQAFRADPRCRPRSSAARCRSCRCRPCPPARGTRSCWRTGRVRGLRRGRGGRRRLRLRRARPARRRARARRQVGSAPSRRRHG